MEGRQCVDADGGFAGVAAAPSALPGADGDAAAVADPVGGAAAGGLPADRLAVHRGPVAERPVVAAPVDSGGERRVEELLEVVRGDACERVADAVGAGHGALVEPP